MPLLKSTCGTTSAGQKEGGQALLGGLDISVSRNFFGAQVRACFISGRQHSCQSRSVLILWRC